MNPFRLRYVDAGDLDDSAVDFDGADVETTSGDKLGDVDGFLLEVESARPYYVVVSAGSWFKSKYFLIPVGHVRFEAGRNAFIADIDRARVERFPGFDRDLFEKASDEDVRRMDEQIATACCPAEQMATTSDRYSTWTHYRRPDWWQTSYYRSGPSRSIPSPTGTSAARSAASTDRERVMAHSTDESPHFEGRAQPGDVIGVETAGEETHLGETSEDEDKRRRNAVKDVEKQRRR